MIKKNILGELYITKKFSAKQISEKLSCSENKVHYWLAKHCIPKRSISDATYLRANPNGDPFLYKRPITKQEYFLFGLGLGIYWGEGNKANQNAVRLGNTDPGLVRYFIQFLAEIYGVNKSKLRFGLQIFTDTEPKVAQSYWCKELNIKSTQFHKVVITKQNKTGTYRRKLENGVLTVYFSNRKLRDMIVRAITELQSSQLPM